MTGIRVMVYRDRIWQNLDFAELSDEELKAVVMEHGVNAVRLAYWVIGLAAWIRDNPNG